MDADQIALVLTLAYGLALPVIAAVYWRAYGPSNFLWLSDIALLFTFAALLTRHPLLASMPAVGVLPLEIAWTLDFLAGGRLIGLTSYMFDAKLPRYLRALSLFHLAIPPTLIFLLSAYGYDGRALLLQTLLTWIVFVLVYAFTDPEKNINWVFGPGEKPQTALPPPVYLALYMAVLPLAVFLPMHVLPARLF